MQRDKAPRPARRGLAILTALLLSITATTAGADTIARWVDAEGVTHFGDGQFAPAHAETVKVQPANGMVKPEMPATLANTRSRGSPAWRMLSLPGKQNAKGRRSRNESLYTGRKHNSRNSRR